LASRLGRRLASRLGLARRLGPGLGWRLAPLLDQSLGQSGLPLVILINRKRPSVCKGRRLFRLSHKGRKFVKKLGVFATAIVLLAGSAAHAAMTPVVGISSPSVQLAGILCGHGMHLSGIVCVPNGGMARACLRAGISAPKVCAAAAID
jgi:hypothetical protein